MSRSWAFRSLASGRLQKYWSKIKDFAKDHIPDVIDEIPTNDTFKDMLKKGYEQINKKDGDGS